MADYSLGTAEGAIKITYDGKGVARARDELGRFVGGGGAGGIGGGSGSLGSVSRGFQQVATIATIATTAIAGGIALAVNSAIDFEKQISAIGAVSGASADQMDALRKKALQLGADTSFSASQSAQAMEELVKAGLSVEEVLNGAADATVALAAAGGIDLPSAAIIASNAMNAFGIAAGDMTRVVDLIAGAANASAIDVNQFGMALSQSGAVANLVGVSFDDLAVAIALMGNAGIKGSDAGTSLKTMLQNLQPTTKKQIALMKQLGIVTADGTNRFFDQQGKLKSLAEVAGILNDSMKGMTAAQKAMALETIFGTDAIRAAAILANEGADGFNAMATAMGNVSAQDVAKARLDNVSGALEQLKGSVETAAIAFGTALLPTIRKVAEFITMLVNKFSALDPRWQKLIAFAAVAAAALLGLVAVIAAVGAVVAGVVASVAAIKVAAIIGGIVAAIIAIATAIKLAYDRSQEFRDLIAKLAQVARAAFGAILAVVRPIVEFIRTQMIPTIRSIVQTLIKNLQPAFRAIGDFIQTRVLPGIEQLRAALVKAMPTIIQIAKALMEVGKVVFNVLGKALGFLIPLILKVAGPVFSAWIKGISTVIAGIPAIVAAIKKFISIVETVGKIIGIAIIGPLYGIYQAGKFVFEGLMAVVNVFVAAFMAAWNFLWPVTKAVWDLISAITSTAWAVITGIFQAGAALVRGIWDTLWNFIIGPVINAFNAVRGHVDSASSGITDRLSSLWAAIRGIWDKIFGWVVSPIINAFNAIRDFIASKMDEVKARVSAAWDAIIAFFTSARDRIVSAVNGLSAMVTKVRDFFNQMKDAAIAKAQELISWVQGLPGRLIGAIGSLGGSLFGAGRSLIQGFWDGMVSIWNAMVGWLQSKMSTLRGLWPFSPAKWGPFSGRGWVLYSGRALMEGFAQGMDERVGMVNRAAERALAGVAGKLPTDFSATVGLATAGAGLNGAFPGGTGGAPVRGDVTNNTEINLNVPLEDLRSIKDVQDLLDFIDRLRNDSRRGLVMT